MGKGGGASAANESAEERARSTRGERSNSSTTAIGTAEESGGHSMPVSPASLRAWTSTRPVKRCT